MMLDLSQQDSQADSRNEWNHHNDNEMKTKIRECSKPVISIQHNKIKKNNSQNIRQAAFINYKLFIGWVEPSDTRDGNGWTYYAEWYCIDQAVSEREPSQVLEQETQ